MREVHLDVTLKSLYCPEGKLELLMRSTVSGLIHSFTQYTTAKHSGGVKAGLWPYAQRERKRKRERFILRNWLM